MPGGWHYIINGVKITSDTSFDDLVYQVIEYKVNNKIPVGNVVEEVTKWICESYPRQCNILNEENGSGPIVQNDTQAYLDSLTIWGQIKMKENSKLVESPVAEERAYKCAHCPNNRFWDKQGCKSCLENMKRIFGLLRNTKEVSCHAQLGGCTALTHDNRTAVWLEENNTAENLPSHCWCRKSE